MYVINNFTVNVSHPTHEMQTRKLRNGKGMQELIDVNLSCIKPQMNDFLLDQTENDLINLSNLLIIRDLNDIVIFSV